ncbi:hypothetical protein [Nonomuraea dietziae]|uniref:hypothetical protein n=1 Tax=Nonomuraea dietziae TaxID=65515 RepID=UPI0031D56DE1
MISVRGLEARASVLPLITHDGRQAVRVSVTGLVPARMEHELAGVDRAEGADVTLLVPEVCRSRPTSPCG